MCRLSHCPGMTFYIQINECKVVIFRYDVDDN